MERVQVRSLVGNGILNATGQLSPYIATVRKNPKWRNKDLMQPNKYFLKICYEITSGYTPLSCTHSQYINVICSVAKSCPTLCSTTDCSTPGSLVHQQFLKLAQTHVHRVGDMPSNYLILCHPLLLLLSIFPSISVFSNESVLLIRWPNIGVSASASVLPVNSQD